GFIYENNLTYWVNGKTLLDVNMQKFETVLWRGIKGEDQNQVALVEGTATFQVHFADITFERNAGLLADWMEYFPMLYATPQADCSGELACVFYDSTNAPSTQSVNYN